ncbi:MAG: arylsulfotransferase family protein [Vicinamibacterales bacterium]
MPVAPSSPRPRRDWSKIAFVFSSALFVFAYGFLVGSQNVFPYRLVRAGIDAVRDARQNWRTELGVRPDPFLEPTPYAGNGVTRHEDGRMAPGLTLVEGFFDGSNELRLITADGTPVHRWPVKFYDFFPNPTHVLPATDRPKSEWNAELHDGLALPDGSLVFNFESMGLVKVDRCGQAVWTLPRMVHHVIHPNEDGTFWVGAKRYVEGASPYPHIRTPFADETALKVSADGKPLEEISALEALLQEVPSAYFGGSAYEVPRGEMMHLNDIEPLPARFADQFPEFAAGDLLLSFRGVSLLAVMRPSTKQLVWKSVGRWIRQHDPDFRPDGHITIYSNNTLEAIEPHANGGEWPDPLGASTILDFDPRSGATTVVYGGTKEQPFYSAFRGKHEWLENGNLLIVESNVGRVFEVAPSGDVVWEFLNQYDDKTAAVVYQAHRYPDGYFSVTDWSCPSAAN